MTRLNDRLIGRLSTYRRLLQAHRAEGNEMVYSHELAAMGGFTSAQVRRDMMTVGYTGSPARGYHVDGLIDWISEVLDCPQCCCAALVGAGRLGQAILSYFAGRNPRLRISAVFDSNPELVGQNLHGCECHDVSEIKRVAGEQGINMGIITVPAPAAQAVADSLVDAGVNAILNFAPEMLKLPPGVYVDHVDITVALERVAFRARTGEARAGRSATSPRKRPRVGT